MKKKLKNKTIWEIALVELVFVVIIFFLGSFLLTPKLKDNVENTLAPSGPTLTIDSKKFTLTQKKLKVGDTLKTDYTLDMPASVIEKQSKKNLRDIKGYRLFETVPSLDTPVCSMQTAELNLLSPRYKNVEFVIISMDLPFAQQRYCGANDIGNIHVLSDYNERKFSNDNGLLISENQLSARAIFIVDEKDKVVYVEYADEQTRPLDLQKALKSIE